MIIHLLIFLYLSYIPIFSSLIPLNPKSPLPTIINQRCDESEYQFINLNEMDESDLEIKEKNNNINPDILKEAFQILKLLNPTKKFPNHQRTIFFENNPSYNENIQNNSLKIDIVNINSHKYMVNVGMQNKARRGNVNGPLIYNKLIPTENFNDVNIDIRTPTKFSLLQEIAKNISKYQKLYAFPFCWDIHNKCTLYLNYNRLREKFKNDFNYMPLTYIFPLKGQIKEKFKNYKYSRDDVWIIKPSQSSCGKYIHLLQENIELPMDGLISKYITNPLLINGRKFDLRIYILITGFFPLKLYLYQDLLVRISANQFELNENNLENQTIHLTNFAVNKNVDKYKVNSDNGIEWTFPKFLKYCFKMGIDFNKIWDKIKDLTVKTFISYSKNSNDKIKEYKVNNSNFYNLVGLDILIDENLKPWLLEANVGIGGTGSKEDDIVKNRLMTDIYNIIGIIPYSHDKKKESMDYKPTFKNQVQENVYEAFCEFERPLGDFERIFPRKSNIDYYKRFFEEPSVEDNLLWKNMKELNYE